MGIAISADEIAIPRRLSVTLECEDLHDTYCRGSQTFTDEGGYIAIHGKAMDAGWLERQTPQGRAWACPSCSGKI